MDDLWAVKMAVKLVDSLGMRTVVDSGDLMVEKTVVEMVGKWAELSVVEMVVQLAVLLVSMTDVLSVELWVVWMVESKVSQMVEM